MTNDWRSWLFSAKAFLASMSALFIALSLDLPRPYWAMATVYVVANPLSGATSSKALYRVIGTLLGACAAVVFVPLFINAPELLVIVIACWTGCLLFISMLDRTARSYVFMLAGYTLPMIALPSVSSPETVFDIALARSEEIIIGIVCASVVSAVVFPTSVRTALGTRITGWLDDAGSWAEDIARGEGVSPATPLKRQKLAADVNALDLIISQLGHDAQGRDIVRHAGELRGRLMMLLPLFSSLADRLHALKAGGQELPAPFSALLTALAQWLGEGGRGKADATAERLHDDIRRLDRFERSDISWNGLLTRSALARLAEIVDLWHDCLTLRDGIRGKHSAGSWLPVFRHRQVVGRQRHYDFVLIGFSALSVVGAITAASFFWIFSGWQNGAGFVTMTAVACSFFAAMDRPAPFIRTMFIWSAVSLAVAFFYIFGVLPNLNAFELVVLAFAPPFLLLGWLISKPKFSMLGMLMAVNTATFVALQDRYTADFVTYVNEAVGSLAGIGFALVWTLIARPFGAELAAGRLVRAGWKDLADVAAGRKQSDVQTLSGRILDRLGQIVPRLAGLENKDITTVDGFAELRLGLNVVMLQSRRRSLDVDAKGAIDAILQGISDLYRMRLEAGAAVDPTDDLRRAIDDALATIILQAEAETLDVIDALVGLRRALFPAAAPPVLRSQPAIDTPPLPIAAE